MQLYLIAYDISNNKRRNRISDKLSEYGERVNLSVFECMLTPVRLKEVIEFLDENIKRKTDTVKIYYICKSCYAKSISMGKQKEEQDTTRFV